MKKLWPKVPIEYINFLLISSRNAKFGVLKEFLSWAACNILFGKRYQTIEYCNVLCGVEKLIFSLSTKKALL